MMDKGTQNRRKSKGKLNSLYHGDN
uniref:Uncharacterized protein n=1 Tax=Arundo donax TaxID=35708 RepID=A0A0A8YLZ0_ARUDO